MNKKVASFIASKYFSFAVTVILFVALYAVGIGMYKGFMKPQVFLNLFIDNGLDHIIINAFNNSVFCQNIFFK